MDSSSSLGFVGATEGDPRRQEVIDACSLLALFFFHRILCISPDNSLHSVNVFLQGPSESTSTGGLEY